MRIFRIAYLVYPGTYSDTAGNYECNKCPAGTYNPNNGSQFSCLSTMSW